MMSETGALLESTAIVTTLAGSFHWCWLTYILWDNPEGKNWAASWAFEMLREVHGFATLALKAFLVVVT